MATATMSEIARPTSPGDRFVATGLFALVAVFVALQLMAGMLTPFWGMPAVVYLLLGLAILWRAPRWLLVVAIVVPVLQVGTSLPFMIPGLAHPETPATFLPDVFIVIASLSVVAGAVLRLRGTQGAGHRVTALAAGGLATVAVIVSVVASAGVASAARQAGDTPVTASGVDYPERVELGDGGTLWVDNQDPFRHTFVVEGTGIHAEVPGSSAVRVEADLAPGTYTFFCDVPGHEEAMRGTLLVP